MTSVLSLIDRAHSEKLHLADSLKICLEQNLDSEKTKEELAKEVLELKTILDKQKLVLGSALR
jgi:hypothetical protein